MASKPDAPTLLPYYWRCTDDEQTFPLVLTDGTSARILAGFSRMYVFNLLNSQNGAKALLSFESSGPVGWSQRQCFAATAFCRRPDRYQIKFRFYARVIISVGFNRRYPCVCFYPALATCILLNLLILKMGLKPSYLLSSASVGWSQRQCFEETAFCRRPDRYQVKFRFHARVKISVGFNRRYQWAWFWPALAACILLNLLNSPNGAKALLSS